MVLQEIAAAVIAVTGRQDTGVTVRHADLFPDGNDILGAALRTPCRMGCAHDGWFRKEVLMRQGVRGSAADHVLQFFVDAFGVVETRHE